MYICHRERENDQRDLTIDLVESSTPSTNNAEYDTLRVHVQLTYGLMPLRILFLTYKYYGTYDILMKYASISNNRKT